MGKIRSALNSASLLVLLMLCRPAVIWSQVDGPGPTEVRGYVAVHGCQVSPGDLLVRARPALPASLSEFGPGDNRPLVVRAGRTGELGSFEFHFENVRPGLPYRLGIKLVGKSSQKCGKLLWNASDLPFVVGGSKPLRFDAYSITSTIEVRGETGRGRTRAGWFGADALDFEDSAKATRTFRWRSELPWVTGGQLQVSVDAFPRVGQVRFNPCFSATEDRPTGIIYTKNFPASPGNWANFTVDFSNLLGSGRTGGSRIDRVDSGSALVDQNTLNALKAGRPIYVRVVPLDERAGSPDPVCDPDRAGVPSEVFLAVIRALNTNKPPMDPIFKTQAVYYTGPTIDLKHPTYSEVCYRFTGARKMVYQASQAGDLVWDWAAVQNSSLTWGATAKKGFAFCVPNSWWKGDDEGWLESFVSGFGDVLMGFVDAIGKLITSASELWEDIKEKAVSATAAGLKNLGVPCYSLCRAALETGLEIGLASMGAPPPLPNFNDLVDQGADYLAAQAGSQLGIPPELTHYASGYAQQFIKKAVADMQATPYAVSGLPSWLVPDLRFQPGFLTLALYRTTDSELPSQPGLIRAPTLEFAGKFVQLPKGMPKEGSFECSLGGCVPVQPLLFPMVLDFNLEGLPQEASEYDTAVTQKTIYVASRWKEGLGCYHLFLIGLAPEGDKVFTLFESWFRPGPFTPCSPLP